MAERPKIADFTVGETVRIIPPAPEKSFDGMITYVDTGGTCLTVTGTELPVGRDGRRGRIVTRGDLDFRRVMLRREPSIRARLDLTDPLWCFEEQIELPAGLSLDQLLRWEDGRLLLSGAPTTLPVAGAGYQVPVFDPLTGRATFQHVTVFELTSEASLIRVDVPWSHRERRWALPEGAAYEQIDQGVVITASTDLLVIDDETLERQRFYHLHRDRIFAVETTVLQHAVAVS